MMKKMFTLLCVIAISITTNAALTGFSDDFSASDLDSSNFNLNTAQNAEGHIGQTNGVYQMTDSQGGSAAEIYKSYWSESDTSGSFEASLKLQIDLPGDEQSDVKWSFKGKEADGGDLIEIKMFTPNKKIKIQQRTGGSWYTLVNDTDVGYASGDDLIIGLTYDGVNSNITVTVQVDSGTEQELYNGTGNGSGVANIIADRNSVSVSKFGTDNLDSKATVSIDEWSLSPTTSDSGGDNSGDDDVTPTFNLAFSDDFSASTLDGSIFTVNTAQNAEGHIGIVDVGYPRYGVYQMTDSHGGSAAEIYKSYWNESDTSGSFEAILKFSVTLPGDEQSDVKWTFKGKDADEGDQLEIKMFTPSRKVKVSYKPFGGSWSDIAADTEINYMSGDNLTLRLIYDEVNSNVTVTAQYENSMGEGPKQEIYNGTGSGSGIANIIADRNSVSVSKWGTANLDRKATLSIDEWSIQSYSPVVYPANWGDLDNDGINDALEALFGGDSSDPDDFLAVFAAITNGSSSSGLTVQEALQATEDARANSMSVAVVGGSATIQLSMETSSNLVDWASSTNVNVSMPIESDKQFFRFSFE